jgi:SAM-dependent methyltransferase
VDISDAQLVHARRLAAQAGVAVHLHRGDAADLAWCAAGSQDLVLSVYTFPYVADMAHCLQECRRVLRPGGRLVFSLDHPLRACFFDEVDQEMVIYPVRSYFATAPVRWTFDDTDVPMQSHHRTLAGWIDLLHGHGFRLLRLLEPQPVAAVLDHFWPPEDALAPLRHIPHTAIFVAQASPD